MNNYIVCRTKRNAPRMDVRVCKIKCPLKEQCKEYLAYHSSSLEVREISLPPKSSHDGAVAPPESDINAF